MRSYRLSKYLREEFQGQVYVWLWETARPVFHRSFNILHSHQQRKESEIAFRPCQHLLLSVSIFNHLHQPLHTHFSLISLVTNV